MVAVEVGLCMRQVGGRLAGWHGRRKTLQLLSGDPQVTTNLRASRRVLSRNKTRAVGSRFFRSKDAHELAK